MDISEALNADFIDDQYRRWQADPQSVPRDWRFFFQGFTLAGAGAADAGTARRLTRAEDLVHRYRDLGHLLACMDPLAACPTEHPLLALEAVGLDPADLKRSFPAGRFGLPAEAPLQDILQALKETYCRSLGVEYMHLQDPDERVWLQERMEPGRNRPELDDAVRRRILERLCRAAVFEQFLNKKYVGVTRFSLEGGDALIPLLDTLADQTAAAGARQWVLGIAHRGRLNVQAHLLGRPYDEIFAEFEHCYDPEALVGSGDVKYHNGYLADLTVAGGPSPPGLSGEQPEPS